MKYEAGMTFSNSEYQLVEKVADGDGGEAQVWKAKLIGVEPLFRAIKLRPGTLLSDKDAYQAQLLRFEAEAIKWVTFSATSVYVVNIISVFSDLCEDEGEEYVVNGIISEYSKVGSITTASKGPLLTKFVNTEFSFVEFLQNIVKGIRAGHKEEIVHSDIKPSNILLFMEGDSHLIPKIADFGISRALYEPLIGFTPSYAPPEVINKKQFSKKSDIYSLGLTFFEILFMTLLKKDSKEFSGLTYPSGEQYKNYIENAQKNETVIGDFDPRPYFSLFNSMTLFGTTDRPPIEAVDGILETLKRKALSKSTSYESNITKDWYNWNPNVHQLFGEKLYFILVKGGTPQRDVMYIKSDLGAERVEGYSLHSVSGQWDYLLRIWIPESGDTLQRVESAIQRTARGGYLILQVQDMSINGWTMKPLKDMASATLASEIDKCANAKSEYQNLRKRHFVASKIVPSATSFRIFVLIEVRSGVDAMLQFYTEQLGTVLQRDKSCEKYNVYIVEDITTERRKDVRIIVELYHKNFPKARKLLMQLYNTLFEFAPEAVDPFSFSTLFDMAWSDDVLSDDGAVFSRIVEAHAGE